MKRVYVSKIIKAGALIADTKTLLAHWDDRLSVEENLDWARRENIFGKASRSRVEDILAIFRQRYFNDPHVGRALRILIQAEVPAQVLDPILYFHTAAADRLLHDVVTEILFPLQTRGQKEVNVWEVCAAVAQWVEEGKTIARWSSGTILRVVQGVLATLRDFGILEGAVRKRIAPIYLPITSFAYIAFILQQRQKSGEKVLEDPEWRLFFLSSLGIERFFVEAHQERLLSYHAAGRIIRIEFPTQDLVEYAHALAERAH